MHVSTLISADAVLSRNIAALDAQDMAGWPNAFFSDPAASYVCISAENGAASH